MIQSDLIIRDLNLIIEKFLLVNNITNYVVMNNTANAFLSIGSSLVIAHSTNEVEEIALMASSFHAKDAAIILAEKLNSVIVVSGETDYFTDGKNMLSIKNGRCEKNEL